MTRKRSKDVTPARAPAARLELNRRHRAINDSGAMAGMNARAWRVFSYALAHADFETCQVYLGAKTVAARAFGGAHNRTSARLGIARLVEAGVLEVVPKASTNWMTVYEIKVPGGAYPSCPQSFSRTFSKPFWRREDTGRQDGGDWSPSACRHRRGDPSRPTPESSHCPKGAPTSAAKR